MKKTNFVIAISAMVIIILLATCAKKQSADKIESVTYSKNFKATLTDENVWVDFNFTFHTAINNQEIAANKALIESYYINYLATNQEKQHDIYFKWINLSLEPLTYRLVGYVTPAPTKQTNAGTQGAGDPPKPPPPPPPAS